MEYGVLSARQTRRKMNTGILFWDEKTQKIYPFRVLAVILFVVVFIEMTMIISIPDYSSELEQARHAALLAEAENLRLHQELSEALSQENVIDSARNDGYSYFGETTYIPVFEGEAASPFGER